MNRQLLARAAADLRVEGLKQAPAHLNLEQVLMTYQLGSTNLSDVCSLVKYNDVGESLAGLAAQAVNVIGPDLTNPLLGPRLTGPATIAQLNIRVTYDTTGSTADAGAILGLQINRQAKYGSLDTVSCVYLDHWQHVQANQIQYMWNLGTYLAWGNGTSIPSAYVNGEMGSRIIPTGDNMGIFVYRTAGGTWPANTEVIVQVTVLTDACQPQIAWAPLS